MPLQIVRNDITRMNVDAIVNAANSSLLGGGGVDGAIHRAAGPGLLAECRTLGGCAPGQAKITGGYNLPAKYVIHTVGPIYRDGRHGEPECLASAYTSSLTLALQSHCESVAFPLISAGAYGYPKDEALEIAVQTIQRFLDSQELTVYLVVYDKRSFQISSARISDITEYIDQRYVDLHPADSSNRDIWYEQYQSSGIPAAPAIEKPTEKLSRLFRRKQKAEAQAEHTFAVPEPEAAYSSAGEWDTLDLSDVLAELDESFSQMLLRKIDEKGITDAQCYKRANIDRKLFSKIRTNAGYKPSKPTAIAFAISLELNMQETEELLRKAGFALSHSSKFDLIIEYFISKGNYDIFEINEALFAFDQSLLGA